MGFHRKIRRAFAAVLAAATCVAFGLFAAACTDDTPPASSGGETYIVTVTPVAGAEITPDKYGAKEGETVTVTVEITDSEKYLETLTFNGEEGTQTNKNTFTWTMGAENVTVQVTLGTYSETLSDDFLSWETKVPDQIVPVAGGYEVPLRFEFDETVQSPAASSRTYVASSDQSVIPDDALALSFSGDGTFIDSGSVDIDVTKANEGVAYITLHIQDNSVSSKNATIVKRIEVVKAEDLEVTTWEETIEFDFSAVENDHDTFAVQILDFYDGILCQGMDWDGLQYTVEGIADDNYKIVRMSEGVRIEFAAADIERGTVTVTFDYVANHDYTLGALMPETDPDTPTEWAFLHLSGHTTAGGGYANNILHFTRAGVEISLDVDEA